MSRIIETTLYSFNELSQEAKKRAIKDERRNREQYGEIPWRSEYLDSLEEFARKFRITWEFNHSGDGVYVVSYPAVDGNASRYWDIEKYSISGESVRGIRLRTYLLNRYWHFLFQHKTYGRRSSKRSRRSRLAVEETCCLFTGFRVDEDLLEPIRGFVASPRPNIDLNDLVDECLDSWTRAWQAECEYYFSNECIIEGLRDCEFTQDGKLA